MSSATSTVYDASFERTSLVSAFIHARNLAPLLGVATYVFLTPNLVSTTSPEDIAVPSTVTEPRLLSNETPTFDDSLATTTLKSDIVNVAVVLENPLLLVNENTTLSPFSIILEKVPDVPELVPAIENDEDASTL